MTHHIGRSQDDTLYLFSFALKIRHQGFQGGIGVKAFNSFDGIVPDDGAAIF
jgi:hypothetical protein